MTTWYVRPDTSHSEIRNGTSHATAWGGWSSIVWGGSGVKGGDVLYVCGVHNQSNVIAVGAHGATVNSRAVISGGYGPDPGTITFDAGNFFLLISRDYTTIENLTMRANTGNCIYFYPGTTLTGFTIQNCNLYGGTGAAIIGIAAVNGQHYSDLTFANNNFIGGTGSPLGGAITWTVASSGLPVSSLTRVTIHNNRFTGCDAGRAVVQLRMESGSNLSSTMADIVITDNVFRDCPTLGMEIIGPALTGNPSYYGVNTGLRITGNKFYDMTQTDWEFNLGGAMGIGGFRPSLSPSFGSNIIARNEAYRITGPSGFLNTFYGTFNVFDNYGEDVYASQADGNALLFDHGTNDTVAYGNHFRRVIGNEATENSGCAIMILNTTNITVYGNVFEGCKIGVYIGNKGAGQSSNVYNNTFTDCSLAGVLMLSTADMATNLIRNNIFTGKASVPSVWVKGGTLTSESSNCYHGFKAPQGYTAPPSTVYIDPKLDADYRPGTPELVRSATYLGGKDFNSKHFYNPPNYGAVDDVSATPRYLLMRP